MNASRLASTVLFAALLPACSGPAASDGTAPVPISAASAPRTAWLSSAAVAKLSIPRDACCVIAVDRVLDQIYVSRGADPQGSHTIAVSGSSLKITHTLNGVGGANNVDYKTHDLWLPALYSGNVKVYSGRTFAPLKTVRLGDCPVGSWIDAKDRSVWISAQCGSGDDPVWAVNADTYAVLDGPVGTHGVMGPSFVDPVTGRFYVSSTGASLEIEPKTFAVKSTSFGVVLEGNDITDVLYAQIGNGINIIDGHSEQILKTLALSYTPGSIGVNPDLNHMYLGHDNVIEVREGRSGRLLKRIALPSGATLQSLGADNKRDRIYAAAVTSSNAYLYVMDDRY